MVDLVLLQTLSYIAGAISVVLGVIYYAVNLRESRRNGRITLVNNLMQKMETPDYHRMYITLMNYEWKDYDDFEKKYGSDNNLDSCAYRLSSWRYFNGLGYMLKNNMVDAEVLYNHGGDGCIWMWDKFESVIRNMRKVYHTGDSWLWGFEYLADEMTKIAKMRDPSYFVPDTFYRYVTEK